MPESLPSGNDPRLDVYALLEHADSLKNASERAPLYEEAIRLIDLHGSPQEQIEIRWRALDTAFSAGREDWMFALFAHCLSGSDKIPGCLDKFELLEYYAGLPLAFSCLHPELSRAQVEEMHADFARRARRFGNAERIIQFTKMRMTHYLGDDRAKLRQELERFQQLAVDSFTADARYFAERQSHALCELEDYQQAIDLASKFHFENLSTMRGHWMLGHDEQAYAIFRYQHQFEIGRHDPYFVADHLIGFAGLSQQWDLGCQLIRRHLNQHLASTTANTRFQMLMRLGLFLRLWMTHGPSGPKKIRFARKASPTQPLLEGTHAADKLHDWVEAEARKIADIMDARNGNSFHHRWLDSMRDLEKFCRPLACD